MTTETTTLVEQIGDDDFNLHDIKLFRIERMADNSIWMCAYPHKGEGVHIRIGAITRVECILELPSGKNLEVA